MFWRVRFIKHGIYAKHDGWIVVAGSWLDALERVEDLDLDTDEDGEFAGYDLTVDVLEFHKGIAEL